MESDILVKSNRLFLTLHRAPHLWNPQVLSGVSEREWREFPVCSAVGCVVS